SGADSLHDGSGLAAANASGESANDDLTGVFLRGIAKRATFAGFGGNRPGRWHRALHSFARRNRSV
ncbi:MAG: hypothetical protein PHX26_13460, partial [Proteiniphilum sp.]|nr:hypothetical protein [Proteiniphilum sp.]